MTNQPTQQQQLIDNTFIPRQNPEEALTHPKRSKWFKGWEQIPQGTPIVISWLDACGFAYDWEDEHQTNEATISPSLAIGFLWEITPTKTKIISLTNEDHTGHGLTIPNGCITHIQPLNPTT
jgi:hypothetical protein